MPLEKFKIPITIQNDDTKQGHVEAVTVAQGLIALDPGVYKVAAMGSDLMYYVGGTNTLDNTFGDFLAAGDQQIIIVPGDAGGAAVNLRHILAQSASADGFINVVEVGLYEFPGSIPTGNYNVPG